MKLILLAATAMLAVPALAQTTPSTDAGTMQSAPPAAGTPMTADPAQTADPAMQAPATPAPSTDGTSGMAPQGQPMPMQSSGSMPADGTTPMGGYQPSGAPMTGTMTPGMRPTFQAAQSPSEAYPAPAPMAKYPICKKGQYDKCMQRGGK
ncbi:hypothetical protein [Sphingomonas sp.]|uniref:hypothetical protein n=1 Tax=Sphingomonas sp. TaxID=28214 RepID=UPI0035BBBA5B